MPKGETLTLPSIPISTVLYPTIISGEALELSIFSIHLINKNYL